MTKVSSSLFVICSSSSSCSSSMFPTSSSSISSIAASPDICPYSSTTITRWFFCICICLNRSFILTVSGINSTLLIRSSISFIGVLNISFFLKNLNASFICNTPIILSTSFSYTGNLDFPDSIIKSIASINDVFPSSPTIFFRCVMMSFTSLSSNSKILCIISASDARIVPCSWPSLTIDRISSSVTSSFPRKLSRFVFVFLPESKKTIVNISITITTNKTIIIYNILLSYV